MIWLYTNNVLIILYFIVFSSLVFGGGVDKCNDDKGIVSVCIVVYKYNVVTVKIK